MLLESYYYLKPAIPRGLQLALRRIVVQRRLKKVGNTWPIDEAAGSAPPGWRGWPEGKHFALVLTHDVEGPKGRDRCLALADLEERHGFRSSFNFVGEDYHLPKDLRLELTARGFEVGLHGLSHDGRLYRSRAEFLRQARRINQILRDWEVVGFRSPSMHRNFEWLCELDTLYDASAFDTDPFEPYPHGVRTIFPFPVNLAPGRPGFLELPYTLPQDFTLFVMLREPGIDIWLKKLHWIAGKGGMALLITHPDYLAFGSERLGVDEYPVRRYEDFLAHVAANYHGRYWNALPRDVANFCKTQSLMTER